MIEYSETIKFSLNINKLDNALIPDYLFQEVIKLYTLQYEYISNFEKYLTNSELKFEIKKNLKNGQHDYFIEDLVSEKIDQLNSLKEKEDFLVNLYIKEQTRLSFCKFLLESIRVEGIFKLYIAKLSSKFRVITDKHDIQLTTNESSEIKSLIFLFADYLAETYLSGRKLFEAPYGDIILRKKA